MKIIKKLIVLIITFEMTLTLIYLRLSTINQNQLRSNDYVSSTLGNYRFSLLSQTCQLKLQAFVFSYAQTQTNISLNSVSSINNNNSTFNFYRTLGLYPNNSNSYCDFLILKNNGLMTENGFPFLILQNSTLKSVKQTYVTIDDTGVIRLVSINVDSTTAQQWITMYRQPQPFIATTNNIITTMQDSLSIRTNFNQWGFSASNGQFRIFSLNDLSKIIKYKFTGFTITPTSLIDSDNFKPPLAKFQFLKYQKRCGISVQLNFRTPYVFVMHPYWPQLRILDQTGYQIINIRYPKPQCLNFVGVDKVQNAESCISWICPKQTFELNGKCLTRCPIPYYHQIRESNINRCVIMCEAGSIINNDTLTCYCTEKQRIQCSSPLVSTPLSCLCSQNTFFTNLNIISPNANISCVSKCPPKFYQLQQGQLGMCVSCPIYCQSCKLANNNITFLVCVTCQNSFQLSGNICVKSCQQKIGYTLNGTSCVSCQIKNCKNCILDSSSKIFQCLSCFMPFVLFNGSCLNQCPNLYIMRFNQSNSNFYCDSIATCSSFLPLNNNSMLQIQTCKKCQQYFCWINCQQNIFFHNQSKCFCQTSNQTQSYIPSCQNDISQNCPRINHYFNSLTNQCLKCPFGCLTCQVDQTGYVQCTSCAPMYYLSITIYQNNDCQRETSLVYCNGIYDRNRKFCVSNDFKSLLLSYNDRNSCLKNTNNCLICLYKSQSICTFCQSGYYLYQGNCVSTCPQGYYPYIYQFICLQQIFQNCQVQSPSSINYFVNVNSQTQYISGYFYFITQNFIGLHNLNDPIGQIFVYFALLKKNLVGNRTSLFNYAQPTCKVCNDGYGWNQVGKCEKCQSFCLKCVYSYRQYCLVCHPYYKIQSNNTCILLADSQRPCMGNQFRNQQGLCINSCLHFYRLGLNISSTDQRSINCTYNCPNNWLIIRYSQGLACVPQSFKNKNTTVLNQLSSIFNSNMSLALNMTKISTDTIKIIGSWFKLSSISNLYIFSPTFKIKNLQASDFTILNFHNNLSQIASSKQPNNRLLIQNKQDSIHIFQNKILIISASSSPIFLEINTSKVSSVNSQDQSVFVGNSLYSLSSSTRDGKIESANVLDMIIDNGNGFYHYGRMFIIIFLLIAIINLGKGLNYKLDNIFITFSFIYLILPSTNIVLDSGSYNAYNFLYGFAWSCGLQMFSNPRYMTYNTNFIPSNYIQQTQNNAHSLLFIDSNIMRNGWSIILLLFVIIGLWILFYLVTILLTRDLSCLQCHQNKIQQFSYEKQQQQKVQTNDLNPNNLNINSLNTQSQLKSKFRQNKPSHFFQLKKYDPVDADHFKMFTNFTFFMLENCFMGLIYYSVLTINSKSWELAPQSQLISYKIISIMFLLVIFIYFALRFYTNRIGGIYVAKRIIFGIILAYLSIEGGVDQHFAFAFLVFLFIELIFIALRLFYQNQADIQQIRLYFEKKQKSLIQVTISSSGSRQNLQSLQTDQIPRATRTTRAQHLQNDKIQEHKSFKKSSFFEQVCSIPISKSLKVLFVEQFLILIVEVLAILNYYAVQPFILIVVIILCIFLVMLTDQLFQDLIKISIISEKQQKQNFMRIRTSFDYFQYHQKQKSINSAKSR